MGGQDRVVWGVDKMGLVGSGRGVGLLRVGGRVEFRGVGYSRL